LVNSARYPLAHLALTLFMGKGLGQHQHSSSWLNDGSVCCRGFSHVVLKDEQGSSGNSWFRKRNSIKEFLMSKSKLFTIDEACQHLSISRASLYRLIHSHEIACIKIGRSSRISEQALERFVLVRTQAVYDAWS
jgi:excisionase family DNA binding protein